MFRHRFENTGGQVPGAFVSLLKPTQAFVNNPADANNASIAEALAGHIASRALALTPILGRTMYDANLNVA